MRVLEMTQMLFLFELDGIKTLLDSHRGKGPHAVL